MKPYAESSCPRYFATSLVSTYKQSRTTTKQRPMDSKIGNKGGGMSFSCLFEEDKKEIGDGGSDPSTQAGLSAAHSWAQKEVYDSHLICLFVLEVLYSLVSKCYRDPWFSLYGLRDYPTSDRFYLGWIGLRSKRNSYRTSR